MTVILGILGIFVMKLTVTKVGQALKYRIYSLSPNTGSLKHEYYARECLLLRFSKIHLGMFLLNENPILLCGLDNDHMCRKTNPTWNGSWKTRIRQGISIYLVSMTW